jgi:uracil-DNA glycosylase
MLQSHGNVKSPAMFIADGGIGEDLKTNYALSGYASTLLSSYCKEIGLHFDSFWKTALIKEEIHKKPIKIEATEYIKANQEQVDKYKNVLIDEINEISPNLLIPLGELAFHFLTGLIGIRKFRGSVLPPRGEFLIKKPTTKVLPILGPYPFLYNEHKLRFITRVDFTKIPRNIDDRPIPDNFYKIWVAKSAGALRAFLERSYKEDGLLTFDIETYKGVPTCLSFCFDGFESVCIPLLDNSIDLDNRTLMAGMVAKVLGSPIAKVNQNIKYDWKIMERFGFPVNNVIGDTMLAASTIYCEFPKNLGFLTSIYTDIPYFKDEGKKGEQKQFDPNKHKQKDKYFLYNAKDSLATYQIYKKQQAEIDEVGVRQVYNNLICLMPIYRRMEDRGIRIDMQERDKLYAKYWNLFEIEKLKLSKLTGMQYINPLSSLQMNKLVFDELGYAKIRGVKGSDEDSLALLKIFGEAKRSPRFGPLILDSIIAARKLHKVIEILELPLHPDKRFRCEYNLAGAETGRSTAGKCTDELLIIDEKGKVYAERLGHSLQTIGKHGFMLDGQEYGKDIRSMFVPSYGMVFVEADLAGAEARVDAVLAGSTDLSYFDNPGIHKLTGSWCFDCTPQEIKKNTLVPFGNQHIDRYHVAKQVRHAGERNITASGLITKLLWGFTLAQGEQLLLKFHQKQPEIRQVFHRDVIAAVNTKHALVAPNGRRRDFFDRPDHKTYNEAISFLPQAVVTDQTRFEGILPTAQTCDWAFLLEEAHDGSMWEVPKGRELEFGAIYKKNIEKPIDFRYCTLHRDVQLVIPCEVSVGETWKDLKEIKL